MEGDWSRLPKQAEATIVHLPVPKINSPGGADTASGEYTELRSVAWAYVTVVYIQYNEKF